MCAPTRVGGGGPDVRLRLDEEPRQGPRAGAECAIECRGWGRVELPHLHAAGSGRSHLRLGLAVCGRAHVGVGVGIAGHVHLVHGP